ncbi:MAG TPA: hypothetical protein VIW68_10295 [Candidatus Sulfotelmatobacter sp.]
MRKGVGLCLLLICALSLPALAMEDGQAKYVGGTLRGMNPGAIGRLDTTSDTGLTFQCAGNKLVIPYDAIQSFRSTEEVSRHLGALPAIVVGLIKARQHRHFFRIAYHDSNNVAQVVMLEVPKQMPQVLEAVLESRAPGKWRRQSERCAVQN